MALPIVLMVTVLLMAAGMGLVWLGTTERVIAANVRRAAETRYGADAAAERALRDLSGMARWDDVLAGIVRSDFNDGTHHPVAPSGQAIDLDALTADLRSQTTAPGGANTPVWQLFAWGPLASLTGAAPADTLIYVVVWVADNATETDGNPGADGDGLVAIHAEAFGPGDTRGVVAATLTRGQGLTGVPACADAPMVLCAYTEMSPAHDLNGNGTSASATVRILSWREIR